MNTPITPTPDLESLRKAVQEFRPNPRRVPFNGLNPFHDSIGELRGKNASYAAVFLKGIFESAPNLNPHHHNRASP
jgi:hypothetical protein